MKLVFSLCGLIALSGLALVNALAADPAATSVPVAPATPAISAKQLTPAEAQVKKVVEEKLKLTIDEVTPMPFGGLYELRFGPKVIYADADAKFLFVGSVIDLNQSINLTSMRTEALQEAALPKVKFADLPLSSAIKIVKGNGKRQMAIFEDPNCVYCKRLEKSVDALNDVTVYVFLYPILGDDSVSKAKSIWCAKDPAKTWSAWMSDGTPINSTGNCGNTATIDQNVALGGKLQVTGTPTIFFQNGKRVPGAISQEDISKLLGAG
jgi:thiol:disulfide interchange protein DsbC